MPMMYVCHMYFECYVQMHVNTCRFDCCRSVTVKLLAYSIMVTRVKGVYYALIGQRQGLMLNNLVALSLRLCFDAFGYSTRLNRPFGRRGTRGDYRRITMSRTKSLIMRCR